MTKILVIEDNPSNMKFTSFLLNKVGYEVLQASTAQEGIALAISACPQVILMDIQLPGMDGLAAAKLLKEDARTRAIKVIALTAFAMKGDEEKMRAAACDGYLAKPIRYRELLAVLHGVLTNINSCDGKKYHDDRKNFSGG